MATNVSLEAPSLPVTGNVNITQMARNHAIGLGQIDSAASAAEGVRGALQYVPGASGTADQLLVALKNSGDVYANADLGLLGMGRRRVLASSGNETVTEAMSGAVLLLDTATVDYALPAITANNIGMEFIFLSTITSTNQSITAQSGDLLVGALEIAEGTTDNHIFAPDVTDDLIISMNGTTTGGIIGSWLILTAISATRWFVRGTLRGSGTQATPFS